MKRLTVVRSADEGDFEEAAEPDIARLAELQHLSRELRLAIEAALEAGVVPTAVALDTARDAVEAVLAERAPPASRVALARAHGELVLESWRMLRH